MVDVSKAKMRHLLLVFRASHHYSAQAIRLCQFSVRPWACACAFEPCANLADFPTLAIVAPAACVQLGS